MVKTKKGPKAAKEPKPQQSEPTCVFAFRLKDREAIHAAAGRGKASAFALAALRAAVERAQKATK